MNIVNCTWELVNIGKITKEVRISSEDVFNSNDFIGIDCEYLVVKVPAGKVDYRLGLPKIGFAQIESQFYISKSFSNYDFDDPIIRSFNKKTSFCVIESKDQLQMILESMTPMMFSTDRICLDPQFGPKVGLRRYRNWITSEFENNKSIIVSVVNRGIPVGFSMFRIKNGICDVLLGGIYEEYQNRGIGFLTPIAPALYLYQNKIPCTKLETSISSNNYPVIEIYNYLGYKLNQITNVFIRHR